MDTGYAVLAGVALVTFNLSVVPRRYSWVMSALLLAVRLWFLSGATPYGIIDLFANLGYYPAYTSVIAEPLPMWDYIVALLIVHIVFSSFKYGVADTVQYNAHYLGLFVFSSIYTRAHVPLSLQKSLGSFDLISFLYLIAPKSVRPFSVIAFAIVRVLSYAFMIHLLQQGRVIFSIVLTCQLWILYFLVMQYANQNQKRDKRRKVNKSRKHEKRE